MSNTWDQYQSDLIRASSLEAQAQKLRQRAFKERPLPVEWKVGQKVRYLADKDFAWSAGQVGIIHKIGTGAHEGVFWTHILKDNGKPGDGTYWTSAHDVMLEEP